MLCCNRIAHNRLWKGVFKPEHKALHGVNSCKVTGVLPQRRAFARSPSIPWLVCRLTLADVNLKYGWTMLERLTGDTSTVGQT